MGGVASTPVLFFEWWYGVAYRRLFAYIKASYIIIYDLFSVRICLKTLIYPWKRDAISYEGLTLREKFQVWTLNLASRFVGFLIKTTTLLMFLIMAILVTAFLVALIIIWPLYPIIIVALIVVGVRILLYGA